MTRLSAVSLAFALGFVPAGAFAACQARGDLVCGGAPSISSSGDLQVSRGGGYKPLASGSVRAGDRVLVGQPATLALGSSCSADVAPGSLVTFSRSGGLSCARISQAGGPGAIAPGSAAAATTGAGVGATGATIAVVGAVGAGVALAATTKDGNGGSRGTVSAR